jgi:filamentous hemagglutinin family protein
LRHWLLAGVSTLALLAAASDPGTAGPRGSWSPSTAATNSAVAAANAAAQQAANLAAQSQASLAAATNAIRGMWNAQGAARAAAIAGANHLVGTTDVPNGFAVGGLNPDSGLPMVLPGSTTNYQVPGSWQNINLLSQITSGGATTVTVGQNAPAAIANWTTFNVGKNTIVDFDQKGNAGWIVLNRVLDPSGVPSQILGRIRADGQVLLINQNGIIFGGSSQINVHTLIASALDINIGGQTGPASNQAFLQNGLFSNGVPQNFVGSGAAIFSLGSAGAVTVQAGALIDTTSNLTTAGDGGYVALLGASGVTNAGAITTQNGQIILAADRTVTLLTPPSGAVGTQTALQALAGGAPVTNAPNGLLLPNDGAVTLAGGTISQLGGIESTTSVTRPGSIGLNTTCPQSGCAAGSNGNIVLGPSSVTAILPDDASGTLPTATANSTTTANGSTGSYFQTILQPQISLRAQGSIDVQGNGDGLGGALIKAPSAALTMAAGAGGTAGDAGTILLEPGSTIDLSGLAGVTLPMSINTVSILITAAEVADDPLVRNLIGQTITIDARLSGTRADGLQWVGSPLLDAAGFIGLIPVTIQQILTVGGSVTSSARNFIQQPGSIINISGGFVSYSGGAIHTTRLLGADGRFYDIGSADPTIPYVGVAGQFTANHAHWGVTRTWTDPVFASGQFQPGYIAGASAGSVGVTAFTPILQGAIVAETVAGSRQRGLAGSATLGPSDQLPSGGSLSINFASPNGNPNLYNVVLEPQADVGPDPYGLVANRFSFATASMWSPRLVDGAFPIFSDLLSSYALGSVSIRGANQLDMPADAVLVVPGGSIRLDGAATIDGTLKAPAGRINITGFTYLIDQPQRPPTPALIIGPEAVLNVRGLWINDTGPTPDDMQGQAFTNGGSVSITTLAASFGPSLGDGNFTDVTQSIVLAPGSLVDVSSGGYVGANGRLRLGADGLPVGKGGSVMLITYSGGWQDVRSPEFVNHYNTFPHPGVPNQANVLLGGTIYAQGFDGGGTFTLQAPIVTIDGAVGSVTYPSATPGEIVFPTSFFSNSGFSQYTLTSTYGTTALTAGTQLVLRQSSFFAAGGENQIPSGAVVRRFEPVGFAPDGLRRPVGLTLVENAFARAAATDPASEAGVLIDSGASILADPLATVSLVAAGPVTVLGRIVAPSGAINLINNPTLTSVQNTVSQAAHDVWIGPDAVLDVSGTFVPNPQVSVFSTGTVLDGGTITLVAGAGNVPGTIVVRPGAELDLQGGEVLAGSSRIQVQNAGPTGPRLVSETEWSSGGNLQLTVANPGSIYFSGTVNAAGGTLLAPGGTLAIGNFPAPAAVASYVSLDQNGLLPSPNAVVVEPGGLIAANLLAVGATTYPLKPSDLSSMAPTTPGAFIGADTLSNSGFDYVSLTANSTIAFAGSLNVSLPGALTLTAGSGHFVLLPDSTTLLPPGITDPASFRPPPCTPTGSCIPSIGGTTVNLNAGYVRLVGKSGPPAPTFPAVADGTLSVTAQWIDLERAILLDDVGNANFTSAGVIRLLPDNYGYINGSPTASQTAFGGALIAPGNLTLQASEIYPVSNTQFLLMSTGTLAFDSTLTIRQNGIATAPLSVGGGIFLDALTVEQDGTLWAPLGSVVIGLQDASQIPSIVSRVIMGSNSYTGPFAVTQNVILGAGGRTSVSAAGLVIPDGYTIDGTTWYQGTPGQASNNNLATVLGAPPVKSIGIFGVNVTTQTGAVLDLSGGGDIYATEFVSGTGGSRNVLTTYEQNLSSLSFSAQYADGRQVYALVPSYLARVAAYDPNFADQPYDSGVVRSTGGAVNAPFGNIAPGQSITIAGGNGIPAGTYTLLPGMYATLPGAYRVVQVAGNVNPTTSVSSTTADGSQYVSGTITNALTGARSSQQALFQLQSNTVWRQYSQINITPGTSFFHDRAIAAGAAVPPLPIDGGLLILGATQTLSLQGTNNFTPGVSDLAPGLRGAGGQVNISAANILILAADRQEPPQDATANPPYLVLDADKISNLGAASVLIGGTATFGPGGETITANALNLEVETDAAHPLTGPELILVTRAGGANGLTVDAGSVIRTAGTAPAGADRNIIIGSGSVSGDGALLRVSNGTPVNITRTNLPARPTAHISIGSNPGTGDLVPGASVTIAAGVALTIDSSGNSAFAPDLDGSMRVPGVTLLAPNYDLSGSVINIGGGGSGLVLGSGLIAQFAGVTSLRLRSASVFNLFDANGLTFGDRELPIGTLTFDGAGLYSQGGATTIDALNIVFTDSQSTPNTSGALSGPPTGTLNVDAGVSLGVVFGPGTFTESTGAFALGNFAQVNLAASRAVGFSGSGSLNAAAANVLLSAPEVLVKGGATQSLTTTAAVAIAEGAGTAPGAASGNLGGTLSITAGRITDSGTILAPSGNVTLTATSGNFELDSGALIRAAGTAVRLLDQVAFAPAGGVTLTANNGDVIINPGATVDVSAAGLGYAGSLTINAPNGTASLGGTLTGSAAFRDTGGNFVLNAGNLAADSSLPWSAFARSFAITLANGDITVPAGTTLTSGQVSLAANSGSVIVDGTIEASGPSGGLIALYGAGVTSSGVTTGGVTINSTAVLNASYRADDPADPNYGNGASTLVQNGGTIILGTTGTPTGDYNTTGCGGAGCGYELVDSSGAITVATGAVLNVSGGPGTTTAASNGGIISNTGGTIILRAPILTDSNVNVSFRGTVVTSSFGGPSGNGVVLNAYAVWSTTDTTSGSTHFDGVIDPAGWYNSAGILIPGGTTTSGDIYTLPDNLVNQDHVGFYQTTLVKYVQTLFNDGNTAAVLADFAGAQGLNIGTTLHLRPEIALVSPSSGGGNNGGNIIVASNWNLGGVRIAPTASQNAPLNPADYHPAYRTTNSADAGEPGALTLRAANNIQINATISDGFYETYEAFSRSASTNYSLVADLIANNPVSAGSGVNDLNTTSAASLMPIVPGVNLGSFSYDFVAGAALVGGTAAPSANPDAVIALSRPVSATNPTDSVTINGHTTYTNPITAIGRTIDIPTLVRTGTGSIDITSAGNVEFLDTTAPGAVYTAGYDIVVTAGLAGTANPLSGFRPPAIPTPYFNAPGPNGLVSLPQWATGGGVVTITAGQSIIGIETPIDPGTTMATEQFGVQNGPTGQFWSPWYIHYGLSNGSSTPFAVVAPCAASSPPCQTAAWINYATFFQGFGALGGGNIALRAGADIDDVGASLPETMVVSGGTTAGSPPRATYFGGGNLVVTASGNLNSSDFLVGRGTGLIQAGGAVQVDASNPITGRQTVLPRVVNGSVNGTGTIPLPLLLAVQDSFISVSGRGPVTLGNIYDPASLPVAASAQTPVADLPGAVATGSNTRWSNFFTSYGPESGIALTSTAGDVTALTVSSLAAANNVPGLFVHRSPNGPGGTLIINNNGVLASSVGLLLPASLDLFALSGNVSVNAGNVGDANLVPYPTQTGSDTGTIDILAADSINLGAGLTMPDLLTTTGQYFGHGTGNNQVSFDNYISPLGMPLANLTEALHASDPVPVIIAAGQNISAIGTTLSLIKPAEIEAGANIVADSIPRGVPTFIGENNNAGDITRIVAGNDLVGGSYVLYGPGRFVLEAGHDMGPFQQSTSIVQGGLQTWGVATIGNGSAVGNAFGGPVVLPLRPYLPSQGAELDLLFGVRPGIDYATAIALYVDPARASAGGIDFLIDIAAILRQSRDQAWATFQRLSPEQQQLLVDRAFLDFLTQVTQDYNNAASPYHLQFSRAYQAIATLFPARFGYTDDASGGANGTAVTIPTGRLNIAASVLETQMGGDINIIGPGGGITVGHASRDLLNPSQEGILTLAGGTIRAFTDGSILLNQSRVMTQQGGDIDLFSANGDISAGEGPKTYVSDPPISDLCVTSGFCFVNPQGLVSGAGIGALITLPGQDPSKSNVTLAAPHGTIDAGAAGLRGNNITLAALQVLNAYNIQATGTVSGLTFTPPPDVAGALSASNTAGANQANIAQTTTPTQNESASVIIVEVIGYGGGDNEDSDDQRRRQQQSQ